eukprot:m.17196 g.17196  ORF g.17196 m.17196 type:complete len:119 (+) comp7357_c0_seq1:396-752(+)
MVPEYLVPTASFAAFDMAFAGLSAVAACHLASVRLGMKHHGLARVKVVGPFLKLPTPHPIQGTQTQNNDPSAALLNRRETVKRADKEAHNQQVVRSPVCQVCVQPVWCGFSERLQTST